MTETRSLYSDILRTFSVFCVIVLHVASGRFNQLPINNFTWEVANVFDSLVRWTVPVMVMISGSFFLDPQKDIPTKKIYTKYLFRIILALIVWGCVYKTRNLLVEYFINGANINLKIIIKQFIKIPLGNAHYHLWYLYMLIGIYVLVPVYRIFIKHARKKDIEYLIKIFIIFGITFNFIKNTSRLVHPLLQFSSYRFSELISFSGYFFAGYYFKKYPVSKKFFYIIISLGLLAFLTTIIATSVITKKTGSPNELFFGNLYPLTLLESFFVYLVFKALFENKTFKRKQMIIITLSNYSFGIYLIHALIIEELSRIGVNANTMHSLFSIPLISLAVFMISLCIVFIIKRFKFSRFIT